MNVDKIVDSIKINKTINSKIIVYPSQIEKLISKIINILPNSCFISKRFHAIMLLEGNDYFHHFYKKSDPNLYNKLCKVFDCKQCQKYASIIHDYKVNFIKKILKKCKFNNTNFFIKKEIRNKKIFDSYFFKN